MVVLRRYHIEESEKLEEYGGQLWKVPTTGTGGQSVANESRTVSTEFALQTRDPPQPHGHDDHDNT